VADVEITETGFSPLGDTPTRRPAFVNTTATHHVDSHSHTTREYCSHTPRGFTQHVDSHSHTTRGFTQPHTTWIHTATQHVDSHSHTTREYCSHTPRGFTQPHNTWIHTATQHVNTAATQHVDSHSHTTRGFRRKWREPTRKTSGNFFKVHSVAKFRFNR
jgi:hypothetical protein